MLLGQDLRTGSSLAVTPLLTPNAPGPSDVPRELRRTRLCWKFGGLLSRWWEPGCGSVLPAPATEALRRGCFCGAVCVLEER